MNRCKYIEFLEMITFVCLKRKKISLLNQLYLAAFEGGTEKFLCPKPDQITKHQNFGVPS